MRGYGLAFVCLCSFACAANESRSYTVSYVAFDAQTFTPITRETLTCSSGRWNVTVHGGFAEAFGSPLPAAQAFDDLRVRMRAESGSEVWYLDANGTATDGERYVSLDKAKIEKFLTADPNGMPNPLAAPAAKPQGCR
ncbi:hypothetical protein ACI2IY_07200 [Lysobacter enzymogenes]|uniref:hypothetical protein n=1 Tax=Lysobacter enzymogenes TaxID=69 RepID=UPI00384CD410